MTDKPNDQPATGKPNLSDMLTYIFSKEGLEQNLDIALNLNDEGEVPIQVVASNGNIGKACNQFPVLLQVPPV